MSSILNPMGTLTVDLNVPNAVKTIIPKQEVIVAVKYSWPKIQLIPSHMPFHRIISTNPQNTLKYKYNSKAM